MTKFKKNIKICVIIIIKVRDLLLTLLQVITIVSKMNEHRLFIWINTSYMISLVILLAKLSRPFSFFRV